MKLFDGSGEYVPAGEVTPGQRIRCDDGRVREVLDARREGQLVVFVFTDGYGQERPYTSRVLCKYRDPAERR